MDCDLKTEEVPTFEKIENISNVESAENFQKFIYDLFEKNGVISDLRAYLRGHIVNILKSEHSGNILACHKKFTQRLELQYQALNMLIAEYLLNLEFSYSISVFLSEIPLANMVFGFAQSLLDTCESGDYSGLKFTDHDVWSVLNYLGIKCDSENASNIMEMYRSRTQSSLLMCILKGVSLYNKPSEYVKKATSEDTISCKSLEEQAIPGQERTEENNNKLGKCRHYLICNTCQNKMSQIKQKYRKKKEIIVKNAIQSDINATNSTKSLLKNIAVVEKNLIDEMFEHLKSVYEAEIEMIRVEENNNIKQTLATHEAEFEKRCQQMEESFKQREAELKRTAHHKKRFLWGLAQALRQQHEQMTSAMAVVRQESERLATKEENLKFQIEEAESLLTKRGADMRTEISKELSLLESQFENIKREKETISQERIELERIRKDCGNVEMENDLKHRYEILRSEFLVLKNYVENAKSKKPVVEKSTVTDLSGVNAKINLALNNEFNFGCLEDRGSMKTVVNDLKKKNVNFRQAPEIFSRSESHSGESSEVERTARLHQLQEDYDRLKDLARQQSSHIAQLSRSGTASTPAPALSLARPACCCQQMMPLNSSLSANTVAQGAGEHLHLFPFRSPPARALRPGDELPFVGRPLRPAENRRDSSQLINQWRTLTRTPPGVSKSRPVSPLHRESSNKRPVSAGPIIMSQEPDIQNVRNQIRPENITFDPEPSSKEQNRLKSAFPVDNKRDKSPKSVLKEAKQKLRDNTIRKRSPKREASPGTVLREAKLRLRKLEIEAEAVEQSYRDFRLRRGDRAEDEGSPDVEVHKNSGTIHSRCQPPTETYSTHTYPVMPPILDHNAITQDFDKYINDYHSKFDIAKSHFNNKNLSTKLATPIPMTFAEMEQSCHINDSPREDYLEKTLTEFRKLYQSNKNTHKTQKRERSKSPKLKEIILSSSSSDHSCKSTNSPIKDKKAELEILKQNITKMYNINDATVNFVNGAKECASEVALEEPDTNLLRIEVENNKSDDENNTLDTLASTDLVVIVKSSVDEQEINNRKDIKTEKSENTATTVNKPSQIIDHENSERKWTISPEHDAKLKRNDDLDAIFQADANVNELSSIEIDLDISNNVLVQENVEDYADDFSADVDNYNSRSDNENSPISLPKTLDDENFWD